MDFDVVSLLEIFNDDILLLILRKVPVDHRIKTARVSKRWMNLLKKLVLENPKELLNFNIKNNRKIIVGNLLPCSGTLRQYQNLNIFRESPKHAPLIALSGNSGFLILNGWTGEILHYFHMQQAIMPTSHFSAVEVNERMEYHHAVLLSSNRLLLYVNRYDLYKSGFTVWDLERYEQSKLPIGYGMIKKLIFFEPLMYTKDSNGNPTDAIAIQSSGTILIIDIRGSGDGNDYDDLNDPANDLAKDIHPTQRVKKVLLDRKLEEINMVFSIGKLHSGPAGSFLFFKTQTISAFGKSYTEVMDLSTGVICWKGPEIRGSSETPRTGAYSINLNGNHAILCYHDDKLITHGIQLPSGRKLFECYLSSSISTKVPGLFPGKIDAEIYNMQLLWDPLAKMDHPILVIEISNYICKWDLPVTIFNTDFQFSTFESITITPSFSRFAKPYTRDLVVFESRYLIIEYDVGLVMLNPLSGDYSVIYKDSDSSAFTNPNVNGVILCFGYGLNQIVTIDYNRVTFPKNSVVIAKGPDDGFDQCWPAIVQDCFPETEENIIKVFLSNGIWKLPSKRLTPVGQYNLSPDEVTNTIYSSIFKKAAEYYINTEPKYKWFSEEEKPKFSEERISAFLNEVHKNIGNPTDLQSFEFFFSLGNHVFRHTKTPPDISSGTCERAEPDSWLKNMTMPCYVANNSKPGTYVIFDSTRYVYIDDIESPDTLVPEIIINITGQSKSDINTTNPSIWPRKLSKSICPSNAVSLSLFTLQGAILTSYILEMLSISSLPNLKVLRIWDCQFDIQDDNGKYNFSSLAELDIGLNAANDSINLFKILAPTLNNLVHLKMESTDIDFNDEVAIILSQSTNRLETFNIRNPQNTLSVTDLGLAKITSSNSNLRKISIDASLTGISLQSIFDNCLSLETTRINNHALKRPRKIENKFQPQENNSIQQKVSHSVIPQKPLTNLRNLLLDLDFMDDTFIHQLSIHAPNIVHLFLGTHNNITTKGVSIFLPNLQKLETLSLNYDKYMNGTIENDLPLWRIISELPNLKVITQARNSESHHDVITKMSNYSDKLAQIALSGGFRNITEIYLSSSNMKSRSALSDYDGVEFKPNTNEVLLTTTFTDPTQITHDKRLEILKSNGFVYFISVLPKLEYLFLDPIPDDLISMLPSLHSLAEFAVYGEKALSENKIDEFSIYGKSLRDLRLLLFPSIYTLHKKKVSWNLDKIFEKHSFVVAPTGVDVWKMKSYARLKPFDETQYFDYLSSI